MPKYIDFDALGVQSCNPDVFVNKGYAEGWNSLMRILYDAPAADVEPVRHGRWIPIHELRPDGYPLSVPTCFWCDQCKYSSESPRKFCPNCGAKMDAEPPKEGNHGSV